jgi:hypothetical protein
MTIIVAPYAFIADLEGGALEGGNIYIGTSGLNPVIQSNRIAVFSDAAFTVPLAQPVRTEAGVAVGSNGSPIQIFALSADYSIVITDSNGALVYSNLTVSTLSSSGSVLDNYSVDSGAGNAYVVAGATAVSAYVAGLRVSVKITNTNTASATLNYMGLGARLITFQNGAALGGGELVAGGIYEFEYDGANFQLLDPSTFYPRTPAEITAGVTPVAYGIVPGDARRNGYVADGVDGTNTGTDNTTALQNALNSNAVVDLPEGVGFITTVTVPRGVTLRGKGPRKTTLRQKNTTAAPMIILGNFVTTDISDGAHHIYDLCMKAAPLAAAHGIQIGDNVTAWHASMLDFSNLRIWSQEQEVLAAPPYPTIPNQRGIYIQSAASSVFVCNFRNVEVRSFDIGLDSSGAPVSANEWAFFTTWFLDCRVGVRLSNASTWNLSGLTVESGVANARVLQTFNGVSNLKWLGGRWELTQAGGLGIEADGTTVGQNWRFAGILVVITGDGSGIPGLKWSGAVPNDMVFSGSDNIDGTIKPFMVVPNKTRHIMPNEMRLGGTNLGTGKITLGRNGGGGDAVVENTATGHLSLTGSNTVDLIVGATGIAGQFDDTVVAGNTRFLLYDVNKGAVSRVTVGANDSGGAGFKLLRVPN